MIDSNLLKILCCPETHQPLAPADATLLQELNREITAGMLKSRAGKPVSEKIDAGLVRSDGKYLYPVRGSLPILLVDEAIPLSA